MARSKSAGRKAAARKAAKTGKRRASAKKASTTRKRRTAAKKAATTRKRRTAGKKAAVTPKTRAARVAPPVGLPSPAVAEIDQRIAIVRDNLRTLMEQAAGTSGSGSEELISDRIAREEAELQRLIQQRDALERR